MAEAMMNISFFSPYNSARVIHHNPKRLTNLSVPKGFVSLNIRPLALRSKQPTCSNAKMGLMIGKGQRWWEKGLKLNMKEVEGAQDLVDSVLNAGDKLVAVGFFSPGCGGCKALHPKICQLAEMNPDVQFLEVNYEEHKSMCYSLNVHVLPFFRFYRGAHGRLCSFSCTNATINKFKDALAKHNSDRCSLEPTKGLEENELIALSSNKDLSFNYTPKQEEDTRPPLHIPLPQSTPASTMKQDNNDKNSPHFWKMISRWRISRLPFLVLYSFGWL